MIHYATVHFGSAQWIDIQLAQIERFTNTDYRVWTSLHGIDASYRTRFHASFGFEGEHPEKLNQLAAEITKEADPDDLIVFIDGDAFPIDDFVGRITKLLETYPIVAVRRSENVDEPQPHPCFAVTTVRFWNEIDGDWRRGGEPWWSGGRRLTVVGGLLYRKLESMGIEWYPIVRTNRRDLHPVLFAVYGDIVYHHGAAFRSVSTRYDLWVTGGLRHTGPVLGRLARWRLARRAKRNAEVSSRVFAEIERDPDYIRRFFLQEPARAARSAPVE